VNTGIASTVSRLRDIADRSGVIVEADPPENLSPVAAEFWQSTMPAFAARGVLAEIDLKIFEMWCEVYSQWCSATETLADFQKGDPYYETTNKLGESIWRVHPAVAIRDRALSQFVAIADRLGASPAARQRIKEMMTGGQAPSAAQPGQSSDDLSFIDELTREQRQVLLGNLGGTT
jgi:P27 family predicted phage terminase small subunit